MIFDNIDRHGEQYNNARVGYNSGKKKVTVTLQYLFAEIDDPTEAAIVYDRKSGTYFMIFDVPIESIAQEPNRYILYAHKITGNITIINPMSPNFNYRGYLTCFVEYLNMSNTKPESVLTDTITLEYPEEDYDVITATCNLPTLQELKNLLGGGADGQ